MPNDPKWRTIARVSKQSIGNVMAVYIHMLVCASNATERGRTQGWSDEDVATALDLNTEDVTAIREAMQSRVLESDYLTGWEKRQPKREDDSADRAKAWREEQKQQKRTTSTETEQQRTQPNADERKRPLDKTRLDKDKDTEKETDPKPLPVNHSKAQRSVSRREYVEKALQKHPHWAEPLERATLDGNFEDETDYRYGIIRNWEKGDGTPEAPPAENPNMLAYRNKMLALRRKEQEEAARLADLADGGNGVLQ
jgi:hypothetical protein